MLTQGRSPLLSVKISFFDVLKQLLTLHKLTPTSDATSKHSCSLDQRFVNFEFDTCILGYILGMFLLGTASNPIDHCAKLNKAETSR